LFRKGKLLLARRKPDITNGGKWEFPGGKLQRGESVENAIVREMDEEFGMDVQPVKIIGTSQEKIHSDLIIQLIGIYCYSRDQIKFLKDHDMVAWIHPDDVRKYDLSPADVKLLAECKPHIETLKEYHHENIS